LSGGQYADLGIVNAIQRFQEIAKSAEGPKPQTKGFQSNGHPRLSITWFERFSRKELPACFSLKAQRAWFFGRSRDLAGHRQMGQETPDFCALHFRGEGLVP